MLANLRFYRENAKLTQVQLAEQLGIKQNTVSMWESGAASPRVELLPRISKILGCKIDDLFCQDDVDNNSLPVEGAEVYGC